ncbi:hypothetical protein R69658_08249 [Paraburkholderia aspalathi]|uniref:Uncharacterized protein n=1 Tax=Paraburkholderia aspalathi TaxID=1324617 RepID=A0ABM8T955_9BURK|nr:hypothetical protein R69658_08249 [Paraburkholderia aspalathi]
MGERLHGLAKAHVVGQHARQVMFAQELHPAQPLMLVRAKLGLQSARHRRLPQTGPGLQPLRQLTDRRVTVELPASRIVQCLEATGIEFGNAQGAIADGIEQVNQHPHDRFDPVRAQA